MAHRYNEIDVANALDRYRAVTGETETTVERTHGGGNVFIYRFHNSKHLRSFVAYGAFVAANGLDMFCNGYEAAKPK